MKPFTSAAALAIQKEQVAAWTPRLSNPCLIALLDKIDEENAKRPESGYDVFRGQDITDFVCNWKPQ